MQESEIELPVICPHCGKHSVSEFRTEVIADALHTRELRLYAACHLAGWDASESELQEITAHLAAGWNAGWQAVDLNI
ncbi:MAG TPA: hypothetical protein VGI93_14785 [Steroidobacteraceae bacterium]|jgi:5,10-methylenetetrahydrofolate reductase